MRVWAVVILVGFGLVSLLAPYIAPYDPLATSQSILEGTTQAHLLGTDALGRDLLSRILYGGRQTLTIAAVGSLIALVPGGIIGIMWGLADVRLRGIFAVVISALLAIPGLLVALMILTLTERGPLALAVAVGLAQIAPMAQVMQAAVWRSRSGGHIEAARALGAGPLHIVRVHILRDSQPTLLAYASVVFSYCVLNSAALSFLGLGQLGVPDWGVILAEGRVVFETAPHIALYSGLCITATVAAVNSLGDYSVASSMP